LSFGRRACRGGRGAGYVGRFRGGALHKLEKPCQIYKFREEAVEKNTFMVRSLEDMVLGSLAGGAMMGEFDIFAAVVQS